MDPDRFWEIYYDFEKEKSFLEDVTIIGRFIINGKESRFYSVSIGEFIPPRFKLTEPLELIYDEETNRVYVAYIGFGDVTFSINGEKFVLNSSDIVSIPQKTFSGEMEFAKPELNH